MDMGQMGQNQPVETGLPPMQTNPQQFSGPNPEEQRKKRMIYTLIQVISVVFLLISFPLIVQGLLVVGPQFGKTAETVGAVTEITEDLGEIINKAIGADNSSNGCRVHYEFAVEGNTYNGSVHSNELCSQPIGSAIDIVHTPSNPTDNTVPVEWAPYDTYLITGIILLVVSLAVIIGSSVLKSKIPKPSSNQQNVMTGGNYQ